jgi:hypothetical protein
MTILVLDPLWRPNATGPAPPSREDRELVRQYSTYPATEAAFTSITEQMNMVAEQSPATVLKIQGWIDEIEDLEEQQAAAVADGTAFLGNVEEYEGLRPGYNPTRRDMVKKAEELEWDVETLAKVRIRTGRVGGEGTATGMQNSRIAELKARVLGALALGSTPGTWGSTTLERS